MPRKSLSFYILATMNENLSELRKQFEAELAETKLNVKEAVDALRVKWLGKKGQITAMMKQMATLPTEERPSFGKLVNELKQSVSERIENALEEAKKKALEAELE